MKRGFAYWDLQLWQSEGNEEILLNASRYYPEKKIWIHISSSSVQIPPISEATVQAFCQSMLPAAKTELL